MAKKVRMDDKLILGIIKLNLDEGELEPETQAGRSHIFFQNTKNFEWNLAGE